MSAFAFSFRPKVLDCLKNYSRADFWSDLSAGITVGVVALPLAMAFAIASGLKPEAGIFTAIIAGFLISLLGGSKVQIGGPAGAFIVIVYGIVSKYGVDGLIISTIMAGVFLFIMGVMRMGTLVRFVPVSIVIGFTNGIAILISLSQVKELLGLKIPHMPSEFFAQISSIVTHLNTISLPTVALSIVCIVIVFGWAKLAQRSSISFLQRIPGSIVTLIVGTLAVSLFSLPVETIGTKFGGIPSSLPALVWPEISFSTLQNLIPPAITLALLGAIESLLCARVADGLIDDRHNPNQELMAQGAANIIAPLFGGYCVTGTIARTVTNIRSGGKTPVSGIIHGCTLLLIILVAAPLAKNIPLATLGAILLYVAYNMGEWHEFIRMKHFARSYRTILMATFLLTVVIDLTVAVEVGLVLSCLFFITRISGLTRLEPVPEVEATGHAQLGKDIEAYRLSGSLFFGAVDKLEELINPGKPTPKVLVLGLSGLLHMDSSGLEALTLVHKTLQKKGCLLLLAGVQGQPLSLLQRAEFLNQIGTGNVHDTTASALDHAAQLTGQTAPLQPQA
jgi:SulP family sulfate permease